MLSRSSASMPLRQPKGCRGSIMLLKTGDVLVAPLNNNFVSFHCRFAVFRAVLAVDLSFFEQFFCELLGDEDYPRFRHSLYRDSLKTHLVSFDPSGVAPYLHRGLPRYNAVFLRVQKRPMPKGLRRLPCGSIQRG